MIVAVFSTAACMIRRAAISSVVLAFALARVAHAQDLRGTVRDSATQTPLSGVVVTLLDANGRVVSRAISNENGLYRALPTTGARAVSTLHIGFRPHTVPYDGRARLDLTMTPIPPLLEPVTVRAATNCPARADRLQALSLLQQARAGLLATVTARKTNHASLVRLRFVRHYDERGRRIVEQHVSVDSAGDLTESFGAVRTGAQFVADGFTDRKSIGVPVHYGPDAETLLDDGFAAGYCFHVADPVGVRPTEIGLGFRPGSRKRGRVDVQGTLWIDTVSKTLRDIEFEYVGDDQPLGGVQSGGHIEFRQMGNGIVIIDRWALRLPAPGADTTVDARGAQVIRTIYHVQEAGGEVASATWDDGFSWEASLGSLRASATHYREPAEGGLVLRLRDTDYRASPNAQGVFEISHLLPGPYVGVVTDAALEQLGITIPTPLAFEAQRDSLVQRSFSIPRDEIFVRESCLRATNMDIEESRMAIRVVDSFGKPVGNATVDITRDDGSPDRSVSESLDTDDKGLVRSCLIYHNEDEFVVTVTRGGEPPYTEVFHYRGNDITIRMKPRR
jgi:carboxypeptidase family protein